MSPIFRWAVFLTCTAAIAACAETSDEGFDGGPVDTASLSVFERTDLPQWTVRPEPTLAIGSSDGVVLGGIAGATALQSYIAIADPLAYRLEFVTHDGRRGPSIGREGDGPGEYRHITSFARVNATTVAVWDRSHRRVTFVSEHGKTVGTINPELPAGYDWYLLGCIEPREGTDELLVFQGRMQTQGDVPDGIHEAVDTVGYVVASAKSGTTVWVSFRPRTKVLRGRVGPVTGTTEAMLFYRDLFATTTPYELVLASNDSILLELPFPERPSNISSRFRTKREPFVHPGWTLLAIVFDE